MFLSAAAFRSCSDPDADPLVTAVTSVSGKAQIGFGEAEKKGRNVDKRGDGI